jgi:hypothetical protein
MAEFFLDPQFLSLELIDKRLIWHGPEPFLPDFLIKLCVLGFK